MRPSYERPAPSATPIYDSLCAEYRRLFRALPGDRTGEEELGFVAFSTSYGVGAGSWRWREPGYAGYGAAQAARLSPVALPPGGRGGDPHEAARSR